MVFGKISRHSAHSLVRVPGSGSDKQIKPTLLDLSNVSILSATVPVARGLPRGLFNGIHSLSETPPNQQKLEQRFDRTLEVIRPFSESSRLLSENASTVTVDRRRGNIEVKESSVNVNPRSSYGELNEAPAAAMSKDCSKSNRQGLKRPFCENDSGESDNRMQNPGPQPKVPKTLEYPQHQHTNLYNSPTSRGPSKTVEQLLPPSSYQVTEPSHQRPQGYVGPSLLRLQGNVGPYLQRSQGVVGSSIQRQQVVVEHSLLQMPDEVNLPYLQMAQGVVGPSLQRPQAVAGPCLQRLQKSNGPSVQRSQEIVAPSIQRSQVDKYARPVKLQDIQKRHILIQALPKEGIQRQLKLPSQVSAFYPILLQQQQDHYQHKHQHPQDQTGALASAAVALIQEQRLNKDLSARLKRLESIFRSKTHLQILTKYLQERRTVSSNA